ncbi:hypothetical protein M406DRAFT_283688, partial [Cryphonectria parasitica EP155]
MSDIEENDQSARPAGEDTPVDSPVPDNDNDVDDVDDMSDRDSDQLSEVDVDDLEDYDPLKAKIETRPVEIDEDVAKSLKATKRKRADGGAAKKPKEGRRQKKRRAEDDEDEVSAADGTIIEGKRRRLGGEGGAGGSSEKRKKQARSSAKATPEPENEDDLTPEQRRARAIERAMDAALKTKPNKRRSKKDDIDLEDALDEQIADVKVKMEIACENDNDAVSNHQPAVQKLKLLPEVMALLNRQSIQHAILDPETNFLQAVKYFLEPLQADGSLPAYNIQREIFSALIRLSVQKETLLSSGIGKVVLFYTKTKRAQPEIKRMADRLMGEWSRPILKRTDDYKKRMIDTRVLSSSQSSLAHRPSSQPRGAVSSVSAKLAEQRAKALLPLVTNPNRARPISSRTSYTVAPVSNMSSGGSGGQDHRPVGAAGIEAFRKMTQNRKK